MNQIKISITDRRRSISGIVHSGFAKIIVAALTAEPETLPELETAIRRFVTPQSDWPALHFLGRGEDTQPFADGVVAIDLAARTMLAMSSGEHFGRLGTITIESLVDDNFPLPYQLPEDWNIVSTPQEFAVKRKRGFSLRTKARKVDYRPVLFGRPLAEHIIAKASPAGAGQRAPHAVAVHVDWLTTPSSAFGNRTPRSILLEKQHFIDMDLQNRAIQWSLTRIEPPPLPVESAAYRFAGFGSHGFIIHFEYFRFLYRTAVAKKITDAGELAAMGDRWLDTPTKELGGYAPGFILDHERRRRNITATTQNFPFDDDCELCRMMAADFDAPVFWHLDGSGMEYDRFEFSSYKNRREWEAEQRRFREAVGRF